MAEVKPTHKAVRQYYETLARLADQRADNEGASRAALQRLLEDTAPAGWSWTMELPFGVGGKHIYPDATLLDNYYQPRGFWEAKDTKDDLDAEIEKKKDRGYPLVNTIFEDTRVAVLYQEKIEIGRYELATPAKLCALLNDFYRFTQPPIADFQKAVAEFKVRVADLALGLKKKIDEAHAGNAPFQAAFDKFFALCQNSLNPNIARAAVDEMLIQHLLTERLLRKVFGAGDFMRRNVVAAEVEKVIAALVSKSFDRHEYLKSLDRFYVAIERAAETIDDFSTKQKFLNTVYEQFFQGYAVKVADTHGIVYTPGPIVDFMCNSVAAVLKDEFGVTLGDPSVHIIDPAAGTGSFVAKLLHLIPRRELPRVYKDQLFANEVMLLPYYVAALNVEHTYWELTGQYEPFEGLCFVDTLGLADEDQSKFHFMTEANAQRVHRQQLAPITVVIGNPPYNVGQLNENDNNKNRRYPEIEKKIRETYAKDSTATNKNALSDAYVKFFKWATWRLGDRDGVVCFISNNNFVDEIAFDGMRKNLLLDFDRVYHIDLHGNVRKNPKISGTSHNVMGIQVGVGITVAVRKRTYKTATLFYHRVPEFWYKEEKWGWLNEKKDVASVEWKELKPDARQSWLVPAHADKFEGFIPLGTKESKKAEKPEAIFALFSNGVKTNRDDVVYDFDRHKLIDRVKRFIEDYNAEVDRWRRSDKKTPIDDFVSYENVKWSESLKANLERGRYGEFDEAKIRFSLYRPFVKTLLYFDPMLNERRYQTELLFPLTEKEIENRVICVKSPGSTQPFHASLVGIIPDLHLNGDTQCFPFYVYDEDGANRRENITDWALAAFREKYADKKITKWDIFHYCYGLLHHPGYRATFGPNLKRDLPRLPFAPEFWPFARAGKELAALHVDYETVEPLELEWREAPGGKPLSYRVEKMKWLDDAKTQLRVNETLTLAGIPKVAHEYKLGNRSALDWLVDQYQVKKDKVTGEITSDPNRADEPEYVVNLVGRVARVSVETVRVVNALPKKAW